jgi:hypothetical protein
MGSTDGYRPGYPVDVRSEKQRRAASRSVTGDFEKGAARVVARYTGERVLLVDDGSSDSMPDVRIEYGDGRLGLVEVVLDMDPAWAATYTGVRKREFNIDSDGLTRFWFVWLKPHSNLRSLDQKLVPVLARLEADTWPLNERVEVADASSASPGVRHDMDLLDSLGVHAASCRIDATPGIQLVPSGMGGAREEWAAFHDELDRILHSDELSDVRRKLASTQVAERHVFLGVTFSSSWSMNYWLSDGKVELPPSTPRVPVELTHIWVWGTPLGRVLGWFPDRGWFDPSAKWATP